MLLNEMEIFFYVVELKSFSKASERLNVSKSFISKKITKLESELKVNLISRSTRKLTLTEVGESFYRYCATVVQEGNEAFSMISETQGKPVGTLKISIPPALGLNFLTPMLTEFISRNPEVILDIELENRLVDLLKEGYDLVLRSAVLQSSNLIAQHIFSIKNVICATENYLEKYGTPNIPSDLENHYFASYNYQKNVEKIKLTKNSEPEIVFIKSNFKSNSMDLIKKMVLKNVCMAILPEFMIKEELNSGQLKICLIPYDLPENKIYAIYPERKYMLPKLKIFLDMLKIFRN